MFFVTNCLKLLPATKRYIYLLYLSLRLRVALHVRRGVSNNRQFNNNKESNKAPQYSPVVRRTYGDWWIPLAKGQWCGKPLYVMTSWWCTKYFHFFLNTQSLYQCAMLKKVAKTLWRVGQTRWRTGSWRCCLSLNVVSSIPTLGTTISLIFVGFICAFLCTHMKIKTTMHISPEPGSSSWINNKTNNQTRD